MGRALDSEYDTYLRSPHWRTLAQKVKAARGGKCERCGATERLDAHHLTYDRIGCELLEDLMVLCRECHIATHEKPAVNWAYIDPKYLSKKDILELVPDYQEGVEYNERQLGLLADKLLLENPDPDAPVLFHDHYRRRRRHEVYTSVGVPDPSIVEGIYWRTHPNGLAFWKPSERDPVGSGFYRQAHASIMGRDYEYEPEPFKQPKRPVTINTPPPSPGGHAELSAIATRYKAGETLKALADECGLTTNTLYYRLRKHHGVGLRGPERYHPN